ncbi:MAG: type II secretion system protein [Fimbriimonas sp.]
MPRFRRAFTLIELLVVIAIVALLAAILFPVFAQAKAAAKKDQALSNVRQVGVALHLYTNDADDHLPPRYFTTDFPGYELIVISSPNESIPAKLAPYAKGREIWFSPEDRLPKKGLSSFALNDQLAHPISLSRVARPSEAIYLTDRTDVDTFDADEAPNDAYRWWQFFDPPMFAGDKGLPGTPSPALVAIQIAPTRYAGGTAVYQFLDGHAKAMKFAQTWGDRDTNLHFPFKESK